MQQRCTYDEVMWWMYKCRILDRCSDHTMTRAHGTLLQFHFTYTQLRWLPSYYDFTELITLTSHSFSNLISVMIYWPFCKGCNPRNRRKRQSNIVVFQRHWVFLSYRITPSIRVADSLHFYLQWRKSYGSSVTKNNDPPRNYIAKSCWEGPIYIYIYIYIYKYIRRERVPERERESNTSCLS